MITLLALSVCCLVGVILFCVVGGILVAVLSLPFMLVLGLLPWLLRIAGVVLLVKALLDQPTKWENFMPAVAAFVLSILAGWLF